MQVKSRLGRSRLPAPPLVRVRERVRERAVGRAVGLALALVRAPELAMKRWVRALLASKSEPALLVAAVEVSARIEAMRQNPRLAPASGLETPESGLACWESPWDHEDWCCLRSRCSRAVTAFAMARALRR
jgi:hypothetical protein